MSLRGCLSWRGGMTQSDVPRVSWMPQAPVQTVHGGCKLGRQRRGRRSAGASRARASRGNWSGGSVYSGPLGLMPVIMPLGLASWHLSNLSTRSKHFSRFFPYTDAFKIAQRSQTLVNTPVETNLSLRAVAERRPAGSHGE